MRYFNFKLILFLLIPILFFYSFHFVLAQNENEELKSFWQNIVNSVPRGFVQALKTSLKEAFQVWKKIHQKILEYWKGYLLPKIQNWIKREIAKKEPIVKEQIQKEKIQLGEDIKGLCSKSWQGLKDLIF